MTEWELLMEIKEAEQDLADAQKNLTDLKERYKDDADLLAFYKPSAEYMVKAFKEILNELKKELDEKRR